MKTLSNQAEDCTLKSMRQFIENYVELSDDDWKSISAPFEKASFRKNELLLKEGEICRQLWFLESGLLRYFVHRSGEEMNKFFTIAPYFFTAQYSFFQEKPSRENIAAIEDSVAWGIRYSDHQRLMNLSVYRTFAQKITQEVQYFTEVILEELQSETPENRYRKMLQEQGDLLLRLPQKHLASFLGIAPQSLSRIRGKLLD